MLKLILGVLVCAIMCACVHMTRHPCPEIILLKLSLSVWKRVCAVTGAPQVDESEVLLAMRLGNKQLQQLSNRIKDILFS